MTMSTPKGLEPQVELLGELIQTGPTYANPEGQEACVNLLAERLRKFDWDEVIIQRFTGEELKDHPDYVPVESFGGQFVKDSEKPKLNVIGMIRADKPGKTLILNGHYDVEFEGDASSWDNDWNSGVLSDDRVWGRGASDMLGGLTSQLFVASEFARRRDLWCGQIIFNAVVDEEIGGNGTLASIIEMQSRGYFGMSEFNSCLIAEPSEQTIGLDSLGFLHLILRAFGTPRHMAGAIPKDNALNTIILGIQNFAGVIDEIAHELRIEPARFWHTFGLIYGGVDAATPIPAATAEATIFYPPEISVFDAQTKITNGLKKIDQGLEGKFSDFYFDGHTSAIGGLTRALSATQTDGHNFSLGSFQSPCDARLFTSHGIEEVIVYGPGSLKQAHAPNEYIEVSDLARYNLHLGRSLLKLLNDN